MHFLPYVCCLRDSGAPGRSLKVGQMSNLIDNLDMKEGDAGHHGLPEQKQLHTDLHRALCLVVAFAGVPGQGKR